MDKTNIYINVVTIVGIVASLITFWFAVSIRAAISKFAKNSQEISQKYELDKQSITNQILEAEINTQENTFELISKEIHDNISQSLSLVIINLNCMSNGKNGHESTTLKNSIAELKKVIDDLNNLSKSLDSDLIETHGLVAACKFECERWDRLYDTKVTLETSGEVRHLDKTMELFILRIIQESINNAIKYSKATEIKTVICYSDNKLSVSIEDNGIGFNLKEVLENKVIGKHSGIKNIKQRSKMINGSIEIRTSHLQGTRIQLEINTSNYEKNFGWIGRRSQITS
ncbi:MAG: sensor histidine kinase [Sphingobacteriales bacterium]|jgi:two-component system NarL family sensor kinase